MNNLSTDENLLANDPDPTAADLSGQFTHPGYSFKGEALRPYTAGTDLLFHQVLDRHDAPVTLFLAFIFIHLKRWEGDGRSKLLELCWDKLAFRAALIDWIESLGELTLEDKSEATRLFEEMRGWARKTSVEVVPDGAQKKTKATRPRTSRS